MTAPLFNQQIVPVQPLTGPTGLIHYLRYGYASTMNTPVHIGRRRKTPQYRSLDDEWFSVIPEADPEPAAVPSCMVEPAKAAGFNRFSIPLVKRIYPTLLALLET